MKEPILVNRDAEMAAIGCLMLGSEEVLRTCKPEDFWAPHHRVIAEACAELWSEGVTPDLVTVKNKLMPDRLRNAGGIEYLYQCLEVVPTTSNATHYADIVLDYALRRKFHSAMNSLTEKMAAEYVPYEDIHQEIDKARGHLGRRGRCSVDIEDVDIFRPHRGLSSGIDWLDNSLTTGGYPCGQVTLVTAKEKGGKSQFMLQAANRCLSGGGGVLIALVADLDPAEAVRRLLKQRTGHMKPPADLEGSERYHALLKGLKMEDARFYDGGGSREGSSALAVEQFIEAEMAKRKADLVIIDYAQKLTEPGDNRVAQLEAASDRIAKMAKRHSETAFLLGSQITDDGKTRYSRELTQDCGLCLRIERPEELGENMLNLVVVYNRFGAPGGKHMNWDKKYLAFHELGKSGPIGT